MPFRLKWISVILFSTYSYSQLRVDASVHIVFFSAHSVKKVNITITLIKSARVFAVQIYE